MTIQQETKVKTDAQIPVQKPVVEMPIEVENLPENDTSQRSDLGNADRFYRKHKDDVIFCSDGIWYVWTGKVWQETSEPEIRVLYQEVAREIMEEAKEEVKTAKGKTAMKVAEEKLKWARISQNTSRIGNMQTETKATLFKQGDILNNDTHLLNLKNGTLNLDTLKIDPHDPKHYITRILDIDHDPNALCPKWEAFQEMIFPDPEVRNFVQKAVGYSMSGETDEQCLFFLFGASGTNGKTTFLKAIWALLGDYADKTDISALLETGGSGNGAKPYIADLIGKRFIFTNELPSGKMWNTSCIKDLTGGDPIKTRRLYQAPFVFPPTHKLWVMGNTLPPTGEAGEPFWRRIRVIPFDHKIPEPRPMSEVLAEFVDERQGLLNWAIEGYAQYKLTDLIAPKTVVDATDEYRTSEDIVQQFLMAECTFVPEYKSEKWIVLQRFNTFLRESGERFANYTTTRLSRELKKKQVLVGGQGKKFYVGIRLNTVEDEL